jgi:Eukaryotic porin
MKDLITTLALYTFATGRFKARVDSRYRVGVFIEEVVAQNMSAFVCGDLDHGSNKYKFGIGITLQA